MPGSSNVNFDVPRESAKKAYDLVAISSRTDRIHCPFVTRKEELRRSRGIVVGVTSVAVRRGWDETLAVRYL